MTKGYIFDYGGTLDTGGCHWGKMLWHAYQRAGVPVTEAQFREVYVFVERLLAKTPIVKPDTTFKQLLSIKVQLELTFLASKSIIQQCYINSWLFPMVDDLYSLTQAHTAHSREVLQQLKERCPLVLVSNFYGNIETVLREYCLDGLFTHVVESAVVGVRKPNPQIFTLGVEALGLKPEEVTVVGDSMDKDIIPAHQAGCQTVWIRGEQWTDDPVDEAQADRVVNDLNELI
jgi:putative hydrolase of the HAD superfamily